MPLSAVSPTHPEPAKKHRGNGAHCPIVANAHLGCAHLPSSELCDALARHPLAAPPRSSDAGYFRPYEIVVVTERRAV